MLPEFLIVCQKYQFSADEVQSLYSETLDRITNLLCEIQVISFAMK